MSQSSRYVTLLESVWDAAMQIAQQSNVQGYHEGLAVMRFLTDYGAIAYPPETPAAGFTIGEWIASSKHGAPQRQNDAVSIMLCMHNDVKPTGYESAICGCFNKTAQLIMMFDANLFSPLDLALMLLHEGYHARHRLGLQLAGIKPTDTEESHETNTWTFVYNILISGMGKAWSSLITQDIQDIPRRLAGEKPKKPGQFLFSPIETYPATLMHTVFPATQHDIVQRFRMILVEARSNAVYWAEQTSMPQEQIMGSIIKNHLYRK